MIETPFRFTDEDLIPVFVEAVGHQLRFFDDGVDFEQRQQRHWYAPTATQRWSACANAVKATRKIQNAAPAPHLP